MSAVNIILSLYLYVLYSLHLLFAAVLKMISELLIMSASGECILSRKCIYHISVLTVSF